MIAGTLMGSPSDLLGWDLVSIVDDLASLSFAGDKGLNSTLHSCSLKSIFSVFLDILICLKMAHHRCGLCLEFNLFHTLIITIHKPEINSNQTFIILTSYRSGHFTSFF